jgi:hypothetical protein
LEQRAAFDAWLHSEAGLSFQEAADYTPQELARLQLGWMIREREGNGGGGSSRADSRRREIKQAQQQRREEMYADMGIH